MMDQLEAFAWAGIAIIALAAWAAWQRGSLGWIGRIVLVLLAATASVIAVGFFFLGQQMRWTSEGPGLLLVLLGLGASTLIALSLWIATIAAYRIRARSHGRADEAAEGARRSSAASVTVLILVLVVCAVAGGSAWLEANRDKPAHDADIAAVRFVDGKARAFSIDVDGVLKVWSLRSALPQRGDGPSPYAMEARIDVPNARGVRDMWTESGGRHIAVLQETGITVLALDTSRKQARALYSVAEATAAAPARGGGFVMVVPDGLRWFAPGSPQASATLRWTAKIVGLDATANGDLGFADASGGVVLVEATQGDAKVIGTVAFAIQALSFSGDGAAILVLGDKGEAMIFDTKDGAARRPQVAHGPHARPLPGPFALACSARATSCHGIDTATGRSFAAFSGIVRTYDRLDTAPGAVLIASGKQLVVVSMPGVGYYAGSAWLKDPRF